MSRPSRRGNAILGDEVVRYQEAGGDAALAGDAKGMGFR
jgi:hypothetical protein